MKKIIFVGLVLLLSLSACVPNFLKPGAQEAPAAQVEPAATVENAASTQAAETFASLATPTMEPPTAEPPTEEPTATETEEATPTENPTATVTETPDGTPLAETVTETPDGTLPAETVTTTPNGTLPAATVTETPDGTLPAETTTPDGTTLPAETATLEASATSVSPSPTSPIYANEPPAYIPRFKIKVRNNTKVRVYISLQGTTEGGYKPVIEYDLAPWQKIKLTVPEGQYAVVVYVGKDPMIEYIGIHRNNAAEIIIKKDKIKIQ